LTDDEFMSKYRAELNLAPKIPQDIFLAFAASLGITPGPGETHEEVLDRLADYLEQGKERCRSSKTGLLESPESKFEPAPSATNRARLTALRFMWKRLIRRSTC
jgi:hypothetical protein